MKPLRRAKGFTLVEVMVALAISSLGLAAVAASVSQMVDAASSMRQRTYADWIAHNKITEMRLANTIPDVSSTSGEVLYADVEWAWRATVSETGIEDLVRVDVAVSFPGAETPIRTVSGFIGEPVIPGQGNRAWSQNTQTSQDAQDGGERE